MAKKSINNRYNSKLILEELEARQLFSDGAAAVTPPQNNDTAATVINVDANIEPVVESQNLSDVPVIPVADNAVELANPEGNTAPISTITADSTVNNPDEIRLEAIGNASQLLAETETQENISQENAVNELASIEINTNENTEILLETDCPTAIDSLSEENGSGQLANLSVTDGTDSASQVSEQPLTYGLTDSIDGDGTLVNQVVLNGPALTSETTPPEIEVCSSLDPSLVETKNEIIFVDSRVDDYQSLIDDITSNSKSGANFEVILLDSNKDGIAQITETLSHYQNLDSVHLISHGSDGSIDLGSNQLNFQTLTQNQEQIKSWGDAFAANGDFLIYGCNVAQTQFGQSFIDYLSGLTNTEIAASTNETGSAKLGGDWGLEYQTGSIEAQSAISLSFQGQWEQLLAVTSNGTVTFTQSTNTTSLTWAHTVNSGTNRALFVEVSIDGLGANVTSVKYGTASLTQVGRTAGNHAVEIWVLVNPTVGTDNVVVTFAGNTAAAAGASTFNGVNQSTPTGAYASASSQSSGPSTTSSVTVSSAVGDLVIDAQYWQGTPTGGAPGAGQSLQWWQQNASLTGGSTSEAGAASVVMSGSFSSAAQWEIGAVSIKSDASSLLTTTLQQGVSSYTGTTDTYINSLATAANNGSATTINASALGLQQGLVSFDLSSIPAGSTITSARLNLVSSINLGFLPSVNLYKMNTSWTSAANWNSFGGGGINHDGTDAASSSDANFSSLLALGGTATFNTAALASTVQTWVNNPSSNYGWLIQGGGLADTTFYSSDTATAGNRPQLLLTYSAPTPPSLDLDVNNSSGATGSNYSTSFTEGGASVKVADSDSVVTSGSNTVSPNLSGMTVTISNLLDGSSESLAATTTGTSITASYNSGTGVLTLSGSDSAANYQTVLRTITYTNSSVAPSTTSRIINIIATDPYGGNSAIATATITLNAVNTSPTNSVPGAQTTSEDTAKVFSSGNGNQISITDADAAGGNNEITLTVTNGTLTLAGTTGLTFTSGDGTTDSTMTFRGTASAINTALNGLSYTPTANYNGSATLTLTTKDSVLLNLDLDSSLKGRYTFESTGALGTDTSPAAGNTGTSSGVNGAVDSTRGNVLSLSGGGSVQINSLFSNPSDITLAAWVNLTSAGPSGAMVISLGDSVSLVLDTAGRLVGTYYSGTTWPTAQYSGTLAGTGWHHVAFTFNDTNNLATLYLDGNAVGSLSTPDHINYTLGTSTSIGKHANGNTNYNFTGKIDDARIYTRALTDSEIATLANDLAMTANSTVAMTVSAVNDAPSDLYSLNGIAESSLVGVYGFNNASNLGRDDAGNNAPITFYGTPGQTTGPSGTGALDLAGGAAGQYGEITGFSTGGAMTFAASVRFDSTGGWERVFDFGQANSTGIGNIYVAREFNTNNLTFTIEKNGTTLTTYRATATGVITNGTWLHFAATVDASGNMALYINGNLAATQLGVAPDVGVRDHNYIGKSHWNPDAGFDGAIDNLIVANGAMSAANVAALYQQTTGFTAAENSPNGTIVGTVVGFDVDASANPTYSLTDSAGGRFAINSTNGTITVANGSLLDYESATSHSIIVQVTDSVGASYTETFTVNLSNVVESTTATNLSAPETYAEDTALNLTDIVISRGDSATVTATLTLSNPAAGSLGIATSGAVTSTYNAGTGIWTATGAVADVNTLLAGLTFTPAANFNGNFTIATSIGDGVATITGTKAITGTAINDAPTFSSSIMFTGISEDQTNNSGMLVSSFNSSISDADTGALKGIAITSVDNSNGTWQYTLDGVNWQAVGNVSLTSARLLPSDATASFRFVPNANWNGSTGLIYYKAWDQTSGTAGGLADVSSGGGSSAFSQYENGSSLSVSAINDAPTATNLSAPETYTEDTALNLTDIVISDVDSATVTATLTLSNPAAGSLNTATSGLVNSTYNAGTGVWTASGAIADVNTLLAGLKFTPASNFNGNFTIATSISDGVAAAVTGTKTMTGIAVNDAPTTATATLTAIAEDSGSRIITQTELLANATDVEGNTLTATGLTITSGSGSLINNGNGTWTYTLASNDDTAVNFSYSITDGSGGIVAGSANLDITPVNDAPVITSNGGGATGIGSVAENQTTVTTVTVTDIDLPAQTISYSIVGGADAAVFTIDASTGALQFISGRNYEIPTDADANNVYEVIVQASDGVGGADTQAISVSVTPVNEAAPVITSNGGGSTSAINITENTTAVTTVTAHDSDLPVPTLVYSISGGADAAKFAINSSTGVLSFTLAPNYEAPADIGSNNVYDVTVMVSDGSLSDTQAISVTVNNLDEVAPTLTSGGVAPAINENSGANQVVYTATATDSGDTSTGSTSYSLSGADAALFSINAATGAVTLLANPDYEAKASYSFSVIATDAAGNASAQAVTLAVNNLDEAAPTLTSGGVAPAINENSGANQVVYTATATDSGDTSTGSTSYSLSGADAALFSINAATGAVTLLANPDYEAKASYSFSVIATDAAGNASAQAVTLAVNNLDEAAPTLTSGGVAPAINENSGANQVVYTATATDSGDTSTGSTSYSLSGADAALFSINAATGAVTLLANPDYEAKASYSFSVIATDAAGNASAQAVTLAVNNLDEAAPTLTSGGVAPAINENSGANQVVYTATATDSGDTSTGSTSYSLSGADAALFSINAATGAVTLLANPDYEAKASYSFSVIATDAAGNASAQAVTLAVNNLDEAAPTLTSGGVAPAINENSGANQVVYTATATDSGDTSTGSTSYSLSGADAALFSINAATGAVTLLANPDYEAKASYSFSVIATDAAGNASAQAVTLAVNNLDEAAPTLTSGGVAPAINENSGANQVVYTATATDSGDTSTGSTSYSLSGADAALFSINAATGAVTLLANPDYEAKASYSFSVIATDAAGNASAQAVTLAVNNLDEAAPTLTSGGVAPAINENSGANQVVYTATATDSGDTSTGSTSYSLSGADAALFSINAATGAVTLLANPDYEAKASYSFSVIATDAAGNASAQAVTLAVNNLDEAAPTLTSGGVAPAINENSGANQVVYTATATDSGDTSTGSTSYSLSGADAALFSINAATGAVTLLANPDYEAKASYSFSVIATDAAGNASAQAVTLAVNNLDEAAPTLTSGGVAPAINENSGANQVVYTATATDSGDTSTGSTSYSLSGADAALFSINAATGAVTLLANPDYEAKASYSFSVIATDAAGNASAQAVTLAVNNLDEAAPTLTSGGVAPAINENSGANQVVYTATATDSGDTSTGSTSYSLSGADAALFSINAATGAVTLLANPDYEAKASYSFSVIATDAAGNASAQAVTLAVNNLDEAAPTLTSGGVAPAINENSGANQVVYTATATDSGDTSTGSTSYSLSGADAALFSINAATGAVTLLANPDYEAKASYSFSVIATDAAGNASAQAVTLAVNNLDEAAPTLTSGGVAPAINENSGANQVVYTATATDSGDTSTGSTSYSLSGADAALFSINAATGAVTLLANPDYEAKASYSFSVIATDAAGNASAQAVTLAVNNLDEAAPTLTSGGVAPAINENSGANQVVYTATATDSGDTSTGSTSYSLSGADAALFSINAATGAVTLLANPDYEAKASYSFSVIATDAAGNASAQAVTLAVNNLDEAAPTLTSGGVAPAINENSGANQVVYTATATDSGDTSTGSTSYSLSGADAALFSINAATGAVTLLANPDYEAKASYSFSVIATDAAGNASAQAVTLAVNNLDEAAPTLTSGGVAPAINENSGANQVVYTATATDSGDTSTGSTSYSLSGADAALFSINAATGAVTLLANPDYEAKASYSFSVIATDAAGNASAQAVTLAVNNLDEAAPTLTSGGVAPAINENSGANQVVYTATATDSGDTSTGSTSYSLSGADAALFSINAATGAVTLLANPDYEAKASYSFSVIATDAAGNASAQAVTLAVNNLDEAAPTLTSGGVAPAINENSGANQVVYTATATDSGDTSTGSTSYSLSGADAALFSINAATGAVTLLANPDYEAKASYSFSVIATDAAGNASAQAVTLAVNNLDEAAPTLTSGGVAPAINENSGANQVVYTATATDSGDTSTGSTSYSLSGADAALFSINAATGAVTLLANPDYEAKASYSFSVIATDAAGNASAQAVTLAVNNLDEAAPTLTSGGVAPAINENSGANQVVYTATATDSGDTSTGSTSYSLSGADAALFSINAATGAVTLLANPDYEAKASYSFSVIATDAAGNASAQAVTLAVNNLDEAAPTLTSGGVAPAINENSGANQVVYTATATDSGDTSTGSTSYSLSGADAALFSINAATGAVTLLANPDYEAKASYSFSVIATDAAGNASAQAVTLAVNNLDEAAPTLTSGGVAPAINENSGANQVVYTATATDSGDTSTGSTSYSLSGADAALFSINAATGAVTLLANPDYEAKASYSFSVIATDAAGNASAQAVTLAVNNLDEAAPTLTSGGVAPAINENSGANQVVYTATATDSGDTSTGSTSYSLSGADAALFSINAATGAVTLLANPDYEAKASYSFSVIATDAAGNASAQAVTLAVNNLDEAAPTLTSGGVAPAINENSGANQVVYTATATDSGDTSTGSTSYSLSGADAALFSINAATGAVTLLANPDYEAKASYSFSVIATDAAGNASAQAVTLAVNNLDEAAPTLTSGGVAPAINENSGANQVVYTATATDSGDTSTGSTSYSLSGADAALFSINAATGAVTLLANPDYEAKASYSFSVIATDAAGNASAQAVTLAVNNLDEAAPTLTSGGVAPAINENSGANQVVYTATATDSGDTSTGSTSYSLSGADAALFSINAATGAVTLLANPDYEAKASYSFSVIATDAAGNASAQAVTLAVNNLDEARTGKVIIFGKMFPGQTLSVINTLNDPDGLGDITYTWKVDGVTVAIGNNYTLTQSDVGNMITVIASYIDGHGSIENIASSSKSVINNLNPLSPPNNETDKPSSFAFKDTTHVISPLKPEIHNMNFFNDMTHNPTAVDNDHKYNEPVVIIDLKSHIEKLLITSHNSNLYTNHYSESENSNKDKKRDYSSNAIQTKKVPNISIQQQKDAAEISFLKEIDHFRQKIDLVEFNDSSKQVDVQIMLGTTVAFTAGFVSWILRGGALLSSLLSTVPLITRFDPVHILRSSKKGIPVPDEDQQIVPTPEDETPENSKNLE